MNSRENKRQKERKSEEFRSFRTSKRRNEKKQRNDEKEEVKTQNCFMCVKKLIKLMCVKSEKPSNQVAIEN